MTEPRWIFEELVTRLHERVIDIGGGAQGIRDAGLLNSALARPQNLHAYGEEDCFQLADFAAVQFNKTTYLIKGKARNR